MWIDGFNALAHHLAQNDDLAIVAAAPLPVLREHARARGWHNLRVLSAGESTFKYDFGSEDEDEDGNQDSTVSVFTCAPDGTVRHFYTAHAPMADDIGERGNRPAGPFCVPVEPVYSLVLDPAGFPSRSGSCRVHRPLGGS